MHLGLTVIAMEINPDILAIKQVNKTAKYL